MRPANVVCLAISTALWLSATLAAQPPCAPDPGSVRSIERVLRARTARIELVDGTRYSPVKEVSVTAERVSGRLRGRPLEVPLSQVRRIGALAKRQPLARFLRGIAIGGGIGALIYATSMDSEPFQVSATVIGSGAAIGGVIGGIVGMAAPTLDEEVVCEPLPDPQGRATPAPA